jgi:hypothetical protein
LKRWGGKAAGNGNFGKKDPGKTPRNGEMGYVSIDF